MLRLWNLRRGEPAAALLPGRLMRWMIFAFNLAAVAVAPIFLVGPAKSANHFEGIYRGWRLNQADANGQPCGIDVRIDAGQPFAPGLETGGRWASLWVGCEVQG